MSKKQNQPKWVATLRALMEDRGYNPRSLSLKAGLNATAVRDILEGRAKYPRYDTVEALSKALEVTPNDLMKRKAKDVLVNGPTSSTTAPAVKQDDLELLTSIISKLQEVAAEYKEEIKPKDFAAMVTTIYSHVQSDNNALEKDVLSNPINQLVTYERLRKQANS